MDDAETSTVAPSMMSSTTAASTTGTSPPTSPRATADLRADLKAALEAKAAAETRASVLEAELARFKDQFTFAHAAKEALEAQLREEISRREKAEEQVESLRGAVDAARRGVMQLQKQENDRAARRQSGFFDDESSRKRQSLYLGNRRPVSQGPPPEEEKKDDKSEKPGGLRELRLGAGAGHTRNKSVNLRAPAPLNVDSLPTSPRRAARSPRSPRRSHSPRSVSPPATAATLTPPKSPPPFGIPSPTAVDRRASALSVASASSLQAPAPMLQAAVPILPVTNEQIEQLKAARIETLALRAHVEALEMKLLEADEARAASDDCLRALREFLAADPNAGGGSVSLPPLPHEIGDEEVPAPEPEKKGWGFGLWTDAPKRRGSSSASIAPSITSVTSPPPVPEALPPVFENMPDPMALDKLPPPPPPKDDKAKESSEDKKEDKEDKAETKGWLAGWRSTSMVTPAPAPPPPEPVPAPEGANLGRSLTSFFGRRARAASLAAAKAEADKAEAEAYSKERDEDAPLSSAVAAAAGETSEYGFKLPRTESEGSLKTLAARAERISGDDDSSRVAAAKAKEAMAAERAKKRRAKAAECLPGAMTADQILQAQEKEEAKAREAKEAKEEAEAEEAEEEEAKAKAKEEEAKAKETKEAVKHDDDDDDGHGLAYLADEAEAKPALSVATSASALSAGTLSPPPSSRSPGQRSSLSSPSLDKSLSRRRNSPTSSPVSPALSRGSSLSPANRVSPNPDGDEREELADERGDGPKDDEPIHVPKRPQRRNASKRGRGSAKVSRGRGGFV